MDVGAARIDFRMELASVVSLPKGVGGLKIDSFAICYQATTLGKERLSRRIGTLSGADISRVETGLLAAYGIF